MVEMSKSRVSRCFNRTLRKKIAVKSERTDVSNAKCGILALGSTDHGYYFYSYNSADIKELIRKLESTMLRLRTCQTSASLARLWPT
jgi:hypothetical protein